MTHYIRQQYLHVDLKGSESDGFALQNQLSEIYYSKVLFAIENVLDQCSPPGGKLVIDRLEIDAGTIDAATIGEDLAPAVARALKQCLEKEALKATLMPAIVNRKVTYIQSYSENIWEVFIYFLSYGNLPWSYKLPDGKSLEEVLSVELITNRSGISGTVPAEKIIDLLKSQNATRRLVLQFSESFIQRLLHEVSPELIHPIEELDKLFGLADDNLLTPEILHSLKKLVLQQIIREVTLSHQISVIEIAKKVITELRTNPDLAILVSKVFAPVLSDIETQQTGYADRKIEIEEGAVIQMNMKLTANINQWEGVLVAETAAGIFIDNAGLVLLHPFLPQLFEELGIVREEEMVQPERALSLLHYLITGEIVSPEYELVLPKILCGIPLSEPVALTLGLSETELGEAATLLEAVLQHWEALRNTSADGLRGNFLVRPGKLTQKDDGDWLLQVEPRAFDVLLDQLPWGISMIKLPWMNRMLWVEWR